MQPAPSRDISMASCSWRAADATRTGSTFDAASFVNGVELFVDGGYVQI